MIIIWKWFESWSIKNMNFCICTSYSFCIKMTLFWNECTLMNWSVQSCSIFILIQMNHYKSLLKISLHMSSANNLISMCLAWSTISEILNEFAANDFQSCINLKQSFKKMIIHCTNVVKMNEFKQSKCMTEMLKWTTFELFYIIHIWHANTALIKWSYWFKYLKWFKYLNHQDWFRFLILKSSIQFNF